MGLFGNKRKFLSGINKLWENHRQVGGSRGGGGEREACFFMEKKVKLGRLVGAKSPLE